MKKNSKNGDVEERHFLNSQKNENEIISTLNQGRIYIYNDEVERDIKKSIFDVQNKFKMMIKIIILINIERKNNEKIMKKFRK